LDISEPILKEYLIPKDYEKPRIEIGNYFLKWDDNNNKSYGIHPREIAELKGFLTKAISFLDTSYELLSKLERPKHKGKYSFHIEIKIIESAMNCIWDQTVLHLLTE
jgi:hypothetical protein